MELILDKNKKRAPVSGGIPLLQGTDHGEKDSRPGAGCPPFENVHRS